MRPVAAKGITKDLTDHLGPASVVFLVRAERIPPRTDPNLLRSIIDKAAEGVQGTEMAGLFAGAGQISLVRQSIHTVPPQAGATVPVKWNYHWSNFSPSAALEEMAEYAHRRCGVEQFHEEAEGLLGWDQYQGRLWPGFHRNSVLVMLAYSFLVKQEFQHRQQVTLRGRPRGAFSPSA